MKLRVLHICNDFLGSTVYKELYAKLAGLDVHQIVYYPLRKLTVKKSQALKELDITYDTIPSAILKSHHRIFFKSKIDFLFRDITKKVDFKAVDYIHATTLFSDGAIALRLFKRYDTPYVVTIRNTDLNLFFKYMVHLRTLGVDILRNARHIIFISPHYLERFADLPFVRKHYSELRDKIKVMPNGVGDFWVENYTGNRNNLLDPIQLLYIGKFTKGKNVKRLIHAVEELNLKLPRRYVLNIVGGGGGNGEIERLIREKEFIIYHGKIDNKNELMSLMRKCNVFAMPSKRETFGLVYIEALSQGLPLIYTENEGIDGLYLNVGESVDPYSKESIKRGIERVVENYAEYKFDSYEIVQKHDWKQIAKDYLDIYSENENDN